MGKEKEDHVMVRAHVRGRAACAIAAVLLFFLPVTLFAGPAVKDLFVTDVTPRSFSVIWVSAEASRIDFPYLFVYSDPDGLIPVLDAEVTPHPVENGSTDIQGLAEDNGVMKVRVKGLEPDTAYYFQTITTSKITSETTLYPEEPPFPAVTTEKRASRSRESGEDVVPFTNDLVYAECFFDDGVTPAEGTLLIATVEGGDYPVSVFVGDGIDPPFALIDLNNVFGRDSNESLNVTQNGNLTLVNFRGKFGNALVTHRVPGDSGLCEIRLPDPAFITGWNMLSLQLEPDESGVEKVLASLWESFVSIWEYDTQLDKWLRYDRTGPSFLNTLVELHATRGYWIIMDSSASLKIQGAFVSEAMPVYTGWNLLGYHSIESWCIPGAVESVESVLDSIWGYETASDTWLRYSPAGPPFLNDLEWIVPGKAYWILATGEAEW
jgi:hypothetical protein